MKVPKRLIASLAVAIVLIGVIAYFLLAPSRAQREQAQRESGSQTEPGLRTDENGMPVIDDDPAAHLERYRKWAQYPPNSRPLFAGQVDLLDPYNAEKNPVYVVQTPAEGCSANAQGLLECAKKAVFSDVECKLTPERYISIGTKDFHLYLSCTSKKQNEGKPLAIESIETKFYRQLFKNIIPSLPPIAVGDDGANGDEKAGDHIYTITVRPTSQDWGDMFLEAEFKVAGFKHVQRADFFSTPHKTAEFQSGIRDANRNGQLVVSVPVNVFKAGYYKFDANLVQKEDDHQPVASASWEGDLTPGAQTIDIQFFGKVIKDQKLNGPYVVKNLRGMRNNSPVTPSMLKNAIASGKPIGPQQHKEPLQEYMEPYAGDYSTQAYRADDFSSDEWQSEEKDRRIKYLESLGTN
ncbi:MAG TPA: hypothetical protein PKE49_18545 [Leptospiraceae bacterium]|jgi:hypothetical protein|nr:hypothetical protein [Leptospirales bacterium]HMX58534.1 hypothetical protein [Leptospiraceae bacterium]HMY45691.1 hypothetical protein [Leptospiraceae bacterium]HMZ36766.1 hypothetical protein [Leptospiraceae bacterium]HNE23912.1 hypothetical protein [Leptospiraceae bacterium]